MHIKPKQGLVVRDPDLRDYLPEAGRTVPDSSYWLRRLADGDVQHVRHRKKSGPQKPLQLKQKMTRRLHDSIYQFTVKHSRTTVLCGS